MASPLKQLFIVFALNALALVLIHLALIYWHLNPDFMCYFSSRIQQILYLSFLLQSHIFIALLLPACLFVMHIKTNGSKPIQSILALFVLSLLFLSLIIFQCSLSLFIIVSLLFALPCLLTLYERKAFPTFVKPFAILLILSLLLTTGFNALCLYGSGTSDYNPCSNTDESMSTSSASF